MASGLSPAREGRRVPGWLFPCALLIAVLLSRLPLLFNGYGSDDDAWRNAVAGLHVRTLGHYVPSRVPGYPVFEAIVATLVPWGPVATNATAILFELAAVALFLGIAARLRLPSRNWTTLAFAFGTGMWVFASQTMDYAFGIAFVLAAYLALLSGRHWAAGILLALAAGCRLSHGALVVSGCLFLLLRRERAPAWLAFCGAFTVVTALLFAPVVASPALGDLRAHAARHLLRAYVTPDTVLGVLRGALVIAFGKMGTGVLVVALLAGGWRALRGRGAAPADPDRAPAVAFEASAAVLIAALYLLVPYEPAYLLPAVAFGILLLGRALPRPWLAAWALALALECLALPLVRERRVVSGWLFVEMRQRAADLAETREMLRVRPATPTVYVVGRTRVQRLLALAPGLTREPPAWEPFLGPGVALTAPGTGLAFAAQLTPEQADSLRAAGQRVIAWPVGSVPP